MNDKTNISKAVIYIDYAILFFLSVLIAVLPVAHTATVRSIALYMPLFLLTAKYFLTKNFVWVKTSFEWQFAAFFAVAVISIFTSIDPKESLKEIRSELITPILLFYIVYFSIREEKNTLVLLKVLFAASLIFSLFSFYDFYKYDGGWFSIKYRAGGLRDPGGGEVAALYHTMVIPLIFWYSFYTKKTTERITLAVLLLVNLLALHMTFTRAAYIAIAAQGLFISCLLLMKKRWVIAAAVLTVLIAAFAFYFEKKMLRELHTAEVPSIKKFMTMKPEEISTPQTTSSTTDRLAMWKTAVDEISKNPFYPHGYGRFLFGKAMKNEHNAHFIKKQLHNTFIGMFFELGLQGFIIFLWMISSFFYLFYKQWKNSKETLSNYISAGLMTMMAGYWVNNFFGSFDADDSKLLFMFILGLGAAVINKLQKEKIIIKQNV